MVTASIAMTREYNKTSTKQGKYSNVLTFFVKACRYGVYMAKKPRSNLQVSQAIWNVIQMCRGLGYPITKTVDNALYWFFFRLNADERETAARECAEWISAQAEQPELPTWLKLRDDPTGSLAAKLRSQIETANEEPPSVENDNESAKVSQFRATADRARQTRVPNVRRRKTRGTG